MPHRVSAARCGLFPEVNNRVCYTFIVSLPENWHRWARTLQRNHLTGLVITLFEGAGPIRLIFSQSLSSISIFFDSAQRESFHVFADILENDSESRKFASFLKNGESDE